jgi:hypothetical protein
MDLFFKDVVKEKDYFLSLFFLILLFLMTNFSILEELTVEAQEDLEILVNEDEGISETDGDTFTDEGNNQQENKPIKIDTAYPSSPTQNFWNDIIILIIGISVAVSLYFLIKHLIKKTADSLGLDKRQLKGINNNCHYNYNNSFPIFISKWSCCWCNKCNCWYYYWFFFKKYNKQCNSRNIVIVV